MRTSKDEPLDEILNNRYHNADCHIGYKHNDGHIEGCSCWVEDPKQAIQKYTATEVLEELRELAGFEDDDWTGNVEIPQQRLMERIRFWEGKSK